MSSHRQQKSPTPKSTRVKRYYPLIKDIEKKARRTVSIETQLTDENLAQCSLQSQSPLFTLPAELRNVIFYYTCLPYDDLRCEYDECKLYYRPEHKARHVSSTGLLQTCRRAWLEANHLPIQLGDHSFWFQDHERRPKYLDEIEEHEDNRLENFFKSLTPNTGKQLCEMHIYAQEQWLEHYSSTKLVHSLTGRLWCPEILIITIPHSDWWRRPRLYPNRASIDKDWIRKLLVCWQALPRLREVRLELEIEDDNLKSYLEEAEEVLREAFGAEGLKRVDWFGNPVISVLRETAEVRKWRGVHESGHPNDETAGPEWVDFVVRTLVWDVRPDEGGELAARRYVGESAPIECEPVPVLPALSINGPASIAKPDPEILECFEREWRKQSSLLKFAPEPLWKDYYGMAV